MAGPWATSASGPLGRRKRQLLQGQACSKRRCSAALGGSNIFFHRLRCQKTPRFAIEWGEATTSHFASHCDRVATARGICRRRLSPVFKDGRPCPCYPATNEQVTYVQSVPSSDGFNATGSNMATYLNVTIAQSPIPKGYKMDGSFFSMRIGNNGDSASDDAGIGTFTKQTGSCLLENPTGYDTGQAGLCTGGSLLFQAAHPFPTPSPNVVHVVTYGGSGPMSVNICLGSPLCAGVPVWQQQ